MTEKLDNIKKSKHPQYSRIMRIIDLIGKIYKSILISLIIFGFMTAIVAAIGLYEWDDYVPINFFGYTIEIAEETLCNTTIIIFCYITFVFSIIIQVLTGIYLWINGMLIAKAETLNSLYRSERLTELLVKKSYNTQDNGAFSQTTSN